MAFVLALPQSSPFKDMYATEARDPLFSSVGSFNSSGTVRHHNVRSVSTSSLSSVGSLLSISLRRQDENTPARSLSSFNLAHFRSGKSGEEGSTSTSRRTSIASVLSSKRRRESTLVEQNGLRLVDLAESEHEGPYTNGPPSNGDDEQSAASYDHAALDTEPTAAVVEIANDADDAEIAESLDESDAPFRRWLSTLRRKKMPLPVTPRLQRWELDDFDSKLPSPNKRELSRHRKSASHASSSMSFVRSMKSATATFATESVAAISRRSSKLRRAQQSSIITGRDPRSSVDTQRSIMDEAAKQRSRKRRDKIEELIRSEESYVADLKALSNAYFTLLGHHMGTTSFARTSAQKTMAELLHLHDDLLGRLHNVVPFAEYDQSVARQPKRIAMHTRWHSVDVVPTRSPPQHSRLATIRQGRRSLNIGRSSEEELVALRCSPQIAAKVARVFSSVVWVR